MNYLVDTQYLLWALIEPSRIGKHARRVLNDEETTKYVSKISFWEVALKYSIGKLKLEGTTPEGVLRAARSSGFGILDMNEEDIATSHMLPFVGKHKDPFDRLIVWQCMRNGLILLGADGKMREYEQHGLRLAT